MSDPKNNNDAEWEAAYWRSVDRDMMREIYEREDDELEVIEDWPDEIGGFWDYEGNGMSDTTEAELDSLRAELAAIHLRNTTIYGLLEKITTSDLVTGAQCEWCGGIRWTAQGNRPEIDHVPNCPVRIAQKVLDILQEEQAQ